MRKAFLFEFIISKEQIFIYYHNFSMISIKMIMNFYAKLFTAIISADVNIIETNSTIFIEVNKGASIHLKCPLGQNEDINWIHNGKFIGGKNLPLSRLIIKPRKLFHLQTKLNKSDPIYSFSN